MREIDGKLALGSLLYDIGRLAYKDTNASETVLKLRESLEGMDCEILDCIKYAGGKEIASAALSENALAYIVHIADKIAAGLSGYERKNREFRIQKPLKSVFNILNGNNAKMYYSPSDSNMVDFINYPTEEYKEFSKIQEKNILDRIANAIKRTDKEMIEPSTLLEVLEANTSYIPLIDFGEELSDISIFDHVKIRTAVSNCIRFYLESLHQSDYKTALLNSEQDFYKKESFLLASMDVSGIQKFIYTITTKKALKTLRARSFYLEIMLEHIVDLLLSDIGLSRANLIYTGGGHCYLLLPHTDEVKIKFDQLLKMVNQWFLETFQTGLFIAGAYVACSSNDLSNIPNGAYAELYKKLGADLASKKGKRYEAEQIRNLNKKEHESYSRECKVCKTIAKTDTEDRCPICAAMADLSSDIADKKQGLGFDFFAVMRKREEEKEGLPLPGGYFLLSKNKSELKQLMERDTRYVRAFGKNRIYEGENSVTKLWVGSYCMNSQFKEYSKQSTGISRIGVIRADVDNLGAAFVSGFKSEHTNLSRTSGLSRQLSLFFKLYINQILATPDFKLNKNAENLHSFNRDSGRNAGIVYSGGDDLFIVGAWDEIIEFAMDIKNAFKTFTEGRLTISAGIGLYSDTYPISVIADEVAELEEESKSYPNKNAVTVFEDGCRHKIPDMESSVNDGTYSWEAFEKSVLNDKYNILHHFFDQVEDRGNSFLYRILELIRNQEERINFARYVYLISRLEPEKDRPYYNEYKEFSKKMFTWIKSEKDRRELKTAIHLYVYMNRKREE